MTIKFGTDGWRAVISDDFTFANVRIVAQAIAEQANATAAQSTTNRRPLMVVGFDTRFLSDRYAITVAEVLAGNGIDVWLSQADAPTPMISYAIVDKQADGGVMITASHNPPRYNGIKLKAHYGGSADTATVRQVEERIRTSQTNGEQPQQMPYGQAIQEGRIQRFNPLTAYESHLHRLVDFERIRHAHLSVAIDAMYGAGRVYMRRLLEDHGCQVLELRSEMNPGFNGIHPEPIARHLRPLIDAMATGRYSLGLATDGDADRIGAVDPSGRFIDPHGIMALLVDYLVRERGLQGSIIKTVSTTQLLNRLAHRHKLPIQETPVGFNYICDLILQSQQSDTDSVLLGGEESGGITIQGHIPEGDGILMGLLLAEISATYNRTLAQLLDSLMADAEIGTFRYARLDQPVRPFQKADLVAALVAGAPHTIASVPVAGISDLDGVKFIMQDNSWLLIRPSGTEPVLRIYAESHSDQQVQKLLAAGANLAEQTLNQLLPAAQV